MGATALRVAAAGSQRALLHLHTPGHHGGRQRQKNITTAIVKITKTKTVRDKGIIKCNNKNRKKSETKTKTKAEINLTNAETKTLI